MPPALGRAGTGTTVVERKEALRGRSALSRLEERVHAGNLSRGWRDVLRLLDRRTQKAVSFQNSKLVELEVSAARAAIPPRQSCSPRRRHPPHNQRTGPARKVGGRAMGAREPQSFVRVSSLAHSAMGVPRLPSSSPREQGKWLH